MIWLLGGWNGSVRYNDVWYSSDGEYWTLATPPAGWTPRYGHTSFVFLNGMWVLGGSDATGPRSDVWYSGGFTGIGSEAEPSVLERVLHSAVPDPFKTNTEITYSVARTALVNLMILDCAGRRVKTLVNGIQTPGCHGVQWHGRDDTGRELSAGVYLVRLQAGGSTATTKIVKLQ
jgi:hypothetical protein